MAEQEVAGFDSEPEGIPDLVPARVEQKLAQMQTAISMTDKLADLAFGITKAQDWTFFGERPWLCRTGCERIRNRMGINIRIIPDPATGRKYSSWKEADDEGEYWTIEFVAEVSHPLFGSIEAFGFATTRDRLLGQNGTDSDGKPIWKPITEVNKQHIVMKAYSNLWVNAITRFVGLFPTKEQITARFGEGVAKVGFRQREENRTPETVEKENEQARSLWAMLVTMNEGDEKSAADALAELTKFVGNDGPVAGVRDVNRLKGRRLEIACANGKKLWNAMLEKNPDKAEFLKGLLKSKLEAGKGGKP